MPIPLFCPHGAHRVSADPPEPQFVLVPDYLAPAFHESKSSEFASRRSQADATRELQADATWVVQLVRRGCCSWCSILSSFKGLLVREFFSHGNIRFRLVCAPSRHFKGRNHSWMNDFVEGNAIFGRVKSAESPDFTRQVEVANSFLYY